MNGKKIAVFLLQAVISIVFLWLAFRNVNAAQLFHSLTSVKCSWVLLGIAAYIAALAARIWRWKRMLAQSHSQITFRMCAKPFLASMSMNNFLPFRVGDMVRVFAFNRSLAITTADSIASLVVERVLDVFIFTIALGVTITAFGLYQSRSLILTSMLPLCVIISGCLLLAIFYPRIFLSPAKIVCGIIAIVSPNLANKVIGTVNHTIEGISTITGFHLSLRLLFDTVIVCVLDATLYILLAYSFPAMKNPTAALLAVPACSLSLAVPSAPGGVGPFEYFGSLSMTLLGNESSLVSTFILLVHSTVLFVPFFCFLALWLIDKVTFLHGRSQ